MPSIKLTTAEVKSILSFRLKYHSCRTWSFSALLLLLYFIVIFLFLLLCLCSLQFDFNASPNKSPVLNILSICLRPLSHSVVHLYNFSNEIAYTFGRFVVFFIIFFSFAFADPLEWKTPSNLYCWRGVNTQTTNNCADTYKMHIPMTDVCSLKFR